MDNPLIDLWRLYEAKRGLLYMDQVGQKICFTNNIPSEVAVPSENHPVEVGPNDMAEASEKWNQRMPEPNNMPYVALI